MTEVTPVLFGFLMRMSKLLRSVREELSRSPSATLDAEVLLAFVLGVSREYLTAHADAEVSVVHEKSFRELITARARGVPVAYLTHTKEFYGLDFYVDEHVLIPRPETELLIEAVLDFARHSTDALRILDVGTGSGCIAVTLAKSLPRASITATDISPAALAVARKNSATHGVVVDFLESDLLANVPDTYDVIVANLPYIGEVTHRIIDSGVEHHEPHLALFGGVDGLVLYAKLFRQIIEREQLPRLILCEINPEQAEDFQKLGTQILGTRFQTEFLRDLAGNVRAAKLRMVQ